MDIEPEMPTTAPKPGLLLLVATTALVVMNMWFGYVWQMRASGNVSVALGSAIAEFVFPVVVALLFSIGKRFRNARSRTKVVFWTSVLLLLSTIANLGQK